MDWISFTGLQLGDTVTWKWYSPYGFYGSTTFIRDDIPSNPADSCICSYSTPDVTRIPGAWHIDVLYNGNFQFADYFSVAVSAANPTPGIKANRQDGELWVEAGTPVSISVNLAPGDLTGKLADWWIVVSIPSGIYSLTSSGWSPGINMLFQYQLVAFTPIEILNAVLPEGEYVFYFGVDTSPNSSLDLPLYFDSVNVKVVKSTPVNQLECKL